MDSLVDVEVRGDEASIQTYLAAFFCGKPVPPEAASIRTRGELHEFLSGYVRITKPASEKPAPHRVYGFTKDHPIEALIKHVVF